MRTPRSRLVAAATALTTSLLLASAAQAQTPLPDPIARGPYTPTVFNANAGVQPPTGATGATGPTSGSGANANRQFIVGTVALQEPNSTGGPATGSNAAVTLQARGVLTYPQEKTTPSPLILLVHGNHGSCRQTDGGTAPSCTYFERNDLGYQYLAENLASNGYVVASLDQDQLIAFQDGNAGKGMHQRRLLMAAMLDGLYDANAGPVPVDADHNLGSTMVGRIDMDRIGLMGHSRGGDATTSFLDFNRTRPAPGRRYDIRASIAVAPVDYERRAPYGTNFLSLLPACDGDVSNLQGARFFERGQYASPGDPFPKVQQYLLGANHNYFNSVWSADADDDISGTGVADTSPTTGNNDTACGPFPSSAATSLRLSGGTSLGASLGSTSRASLLGTYSRSNTIFPDQVNNYFSGDPTLMGDQERAGLALMSEFFRRYVGGERAFEPYLTGELNSTGDGKNLPQTACPTSASGTRLPCEQYVQTDYFAGAGERVDVIRPEPDDPLTVSALGTALTGSGFDNPYTDNGGVSPKPDTTAGGFDWCNPEPNQFTPSQLGINGYPTAQKPCPLPAVNGLGGQAGTRENSPINQSYGAQLSLAWNDPNARFGAPAVLATRVPAADGDVSRLKALAFGAAVNYFDGRNQAAQSAASQYTPSLGTQHFLVQLTDAAGKVASVDAGDRRYGTALQPSTGSTTARKHIVLNQVRVPLEDFAAKGIDLTRIRKVALVFGANVPPTSYSGSVQVSDVRFQESKADTPDPDPGTFIAAAPRADATSADPDVVPVAAPAAAAPAAAKGAAAACTDTLAPGTKVAALAVRRGTLTLRGTAADKSSCAKAGKVKLVQVKLTRRAAKAGSCVFVKGNGRAGRTLPCSAPVALVARGTTAWSLKLGGRLAKGTYTATVSAIDASGNVATLKARTLKVG